MFKEEYYKEMNKITPDPSFLAGLADQMEAENKKRSGQGRDTFAAGKKGSKILSWGSVAAAAVFCIGISLFFWQRRTGGSDLSDASMMKQHAGGTLEQEESKENLFGGSSWYGDKQDAREIFSVFQDRISQNADLKITFSAEENFAEAVEVSDADKEGWVEQFAGAQYLGSVEECRDYLKGTPVYYLLEFDDGLVIKCTVYDDRYFYCGEIDGIFDLRG